MAKRLSELPFEQWLDYILERPITDPPWWWEDAEDYWDSRYHPANTIAYITRAFEDPTGAFAWYTNAQLSQGLRYILDYLDLGGMLCSNDSRISLDDRLLVVEAMYFMFEQLFLPRCSQNRMIDDDLDQEHENPLDLRCYMWWDSLRHGDTNLEGKILQREIEIMTRILDLNSETCRESALHGLGHWHKFDPPRIATIIDNFLAKYPQIRPELAAYALHAREGHVL